jgi:hypothetical protein
MQKEINEHDIYLLKKFHIFVRNIPELVRILSLCWLPLNRQH